MKYFYVPIFLIMFLGYTLPVMQDGSQVDKNIYNQTSQWGRGLIAHDSGDGVYYDQFSEAMKYLPSPEKESTGMWSQRLMW